MNRVLLLCIVAVGVSCAAAQTNLVRNAGFESAPTGAGLPSEGWWLYESRGKPDVTVDQDSAHAGRATVRLRSDGEAKFTLVSPQFEVSPGDRIAFEAWSRREISSAPANPGYVGLAFRDTGGRVFERAYLPVGSGGGEWFRLSGAATTPAEATSAELHLGYTNATGPVWFDDVRGVITNALSLALTEPPKPWPGRQEVAARVINRGTNQFVGTIRASVRGASETVSVRLEPGERRLINVPLTTRGVGQHGFQVGLLDESGRTVRTLEGKFRTQSPLTLFPACPCYHLAGAGDGTTRIDARININPAERAGLRLTAELADATGRFFLTNEASAATGEFAGVDLRVPVSIPGKFRFITRLRTAAGKELASDEAEVRVIERGNSVVTLGTDGFLRVNGKPHFPIGLYSAGQFETMGRANFSATHSYAITTGEAQEKINDTDPRLQELLDRSWANGLRMMVELPRAAIEQAQWEQVRRRIETFRHHPGLLCWGSEERVARGSAPLTNLDTLHQLVRQLDPAHPLVLGDTRDVIGKLQQDRRNFFPDECMDVGIWWWYPIPLHAPDANGLEGREAEAGLLQPPSWLTTTLSKKPLWIAIQSYQQPRQDARFPTPDEYRCMAYLSLINGVKGLWFYTGSGQRDWQGKPAGLLNKPVEGHWDYVQQLVRELRELEPVILGKPISGLMKLAPADAPVEFTVREAGGQTYVLAANKSPRAQTVQFESDRFAGKPCEVLFEKRRLEARGNTFRDDFRPFGVHVYRLR